MSWKLIAMFAAVAAILMQWVRDTGDSTPMTLEHLTVGEADLIEEGYHNAVQGLYRNLFDELITHTPGDKQVEDAATAHFKVGIAEARRARTIALRNIH